MSRRNRRPNRGNLIETLESRQLLCGIPLHHLQPAPAFDWAIERREAALIDAREGGGPEATSIVWTNRGDPSDGFAANFGTSAAAGRAVVDAVLDSWERVITNWNRDDFSSTLQVDIRIDSGNGFGAAGAPDWFAPGDGRPRGGSITLGRGDPVNFTDPNDSNGWFFDPTPFDHSEFMGPILHAYAGVETSPMGADFYSVVSAELTHVLGLITDKFNFGVGYQGYRLESSGMATNTGIVDNAEGGGNGVFWAFDGPTVDHLMTSFNSGDPNPTSWGNVIHTAGGGGNITFAGRNWVGSEDSGNAIYTNERTIPSFVTAHILGDAYGYSIADPAQFGTFHAVLNQTTGRLTIRGGDRPNSADRIDISRSGSQLTVSVNIGNDVPGSGALSGAGDLPAYVSTFNAIDVTTIVVNAGDGNDVIAIQSLGGPSITINGGLGDDSLVLGAFDFTIGDIGGIVRFNGNEGNDGIAVNDHNEAAAGINYTLGGTFLNRTGISGMTFTTTESLLLEAGSNTNTIHVQSTNAGMPVTVYGNEGDDQITVGNGRITTDLRSPVRAGEAGVLTFNDSLSTAGSTYTVAPGTYSQTGAPNIVTYSAIGTRILRTSTGNDTIYVDETGFGSGTVTVQSGNGDDTLRVGAILGDLTYLHGAVDFQGGAGTDAMVVYDTANGFSDDFTIEAGRIERQTSAPITYGIDVESLELRAGAGSSEFYIESMDVPLLLRAGLGDDRIELSPSAEQLDLIAAPLNLDGEGGTDRILAFDTNFPFFSTATITAARLQFAHAGTIDYERFERVTHLASNAASTIFVNSTAPGCPYEMIGGTGAEFVNLTTSTNTFNSLAANVSLVGAAGLDRLTISDTANTADHDWYFYPDRIERAGAAAAVYYGTVETVTVNAGDGTNNFGVNATQAGSAVTINARGGDDRAVLTFGSGNLNNLAGALTFNGDGGADHAVLYDDLVAGGSAYTINPTAVTRAGFGGLTYGGIEALTLYAQPDGNIIDVNGTAPGTLLTSEARGGQDFINVNAPPSSQVTVNGDDPTASPGDQLTVIGTPTSTASYKPSATTPGSGTFNYDSQSIRMSGIESVIANTFDRFTLSTPNSKDSVTAGSTSGPGVSVIAGNSDGVAFAPLTFTRVPNFVLDVGSGDGAAPDDTVTIVPAGLFATGLGDFRLIGGNGQDLLDVQAGTFTFNRDARPDSASLSVSVASGAEVVFNATQHLARLKLDGGQARLTSGGNKVLVTRELTITGSSALDLTDNAMIVDYSGASPIDNVVAFLSSGYNGGAWNGAGVNSSTAAGATNTALGYAEAADLFSAFPATFIGEPVDDTAVLVRHTFNGDANLDGRVNLTDFNRLAANFGQTNRRWSQGDFNFDGTVNLSDFNRLAANFGAAASLIDLIG